MYTARQFEDAMDAFEEAHGGREAIAEMPVRVTINGELHYTDIWPVFGGAFGVRVGGVSYLVSTWENYYLHLKLLRQYFGQCEVPWSRLREAERDVWNTSYLQSRKDLEKVLDNNPMWVSYVDEPGWEEERAQLEDLSITEEDGRAVFHLTYDRPKGHYVNRGAPYPWG